MEWISVKDRLPERNDPVVLLNTSRWENTGHFERNIYDCGYLCKTGSTTYWAIRGQRATALEDYTHWMPLPPPPTDKE